ncbi:MAG: hydroxymethylbilane synthase [Polyangiaceae bacterium]|nr:hydroxymethylbilane synthase [Polyangiaceae bacterium]
MNIKVATRKSALALAQARAWMAELSRVTGCTTEEVHITTTGDEIQDRSLSEIGGKGLFVKEIEEAILDGRADIAIHSLKDVPGELADGLIIGCIPVREDPRDVLVSRAGVAFADLPQGAMVGTSSLRRSVQLGAERPDLKISPLRGNVDTRLRKCEDGEVDAIILAYAGMRRLGLEARVTEVLSPERCLPAVGQGALGIERRQHDADVEAQLDRMHDVATGRRVAAERGVMLAAEGSCQLPIAAFAEQLGDELRLRGFLAEADGTRPRHQEITEPYPSTDEAAREMGLRLGKSLKAS